MSTEQTIDSAMIKDERVCIQPVGTGTWEDPKVPVVFDANLPNPVEANATYILNNPFGEYAPIICTVEIFIDGAWAEVGNFIYNSGTAAAHGIGAYRKAGVGIILQTGVNYITAGAAFQGGAFGASGGNNYASRSCRVFVARGKQ